MAEVKDTLKALRERSNHEVQASDANNTKDPSDLPHTNESVDQTKTTHRRRREQVLRAQRNHRERKERYIKSLERELLRLRDERESICTDTHSIISENNLLREIILAHGILTPHNRLEDRLATVTVIGDPGFGQRLQVSIEEESETAPHIFPEGFGVPFARKIINKATRYFVSPASTEFSTDEPRPEEFNSNIESDLIEDGYIQEPQQYASQAPHPFHLDCTQVAVDFILFLERCCLRHRAFGDCGYSGHALTLQAPLLLGSPPMLHNQVSWEIPASELEKLLELAGALNLDGEVTPVQAWRLIRGHPLFSRLDPSALQRMSEELVKIVHCFGFGAILDKEGTINIIERVYSAL